MDTVIPPRADHADSTYRDTSDGNGGAMQVERPDQDASPPVGDAQADAASESESAMANRLAEEQLAERVRRGRQTVQWPFQSVYTDITEMSSPEVSQVPPAFARRATWQPKQATIRDSFADSIRKDIIPDYIVNYIRGETPETVARRKRNGGKLGERNIDLEHQHRPHHSHAGVLEGFTDGNGDAVSSRASSALGTVDSEQGFLRGSDEKRRGSASECSFWKRLTLWWRAGVALNALLAVIILLLTVAALILAIVKASLFSGQSVVFSGSCSMALTVNWVVHAIVNVLVVALLAGANYVFQVLSSPTRAEVDAAHAQKKWLDIGVASFRNFAYIKKNRAVLALILLTAAILTQVIYNTVIFTTQSAVNFDMVFVTQSFLSGSQFSNDSTSNAAGLSRNEILALENLANRNALTNLSAEACVNEFSGAFETNFDAVLLVTNATSSANSLLQTASSGSSMAEFLSASSSTSTGSVLYCLAHAAPEQSCSVHLNGSILGAAALLNLVTVLALALVLLRLRSFEPLATLGDAISSFLQDPDPATRGACLLSKAEIYQGRWGMREAKYWIPHAHYWFRSPSVSSWAVTGILWVTLTALAATALGLSVVPSGSGSGNTVLSGFGQASPRTVLVLPDPIAFEPVAALLASLPQLLLAALYLAVNSIMTTYFLSLESAAFSVGDYHRPLRVSAAPEGAQTTSLYLTLPRPWSWLLMTLFAAGGFVLSQSVFVVVAELHDSSVVASSSNAESLTTMTGVSTTALGFSGVGLLILLALLVTLAVLVLGLGFRRAPPAAVVNGEDMGNPLALPGGACSAVISARSHHVPGETDVWARPLVWGVVHEGVGMNASHCTYTAGTVARLDMSRSYA